MGQSEESTSFLERVSGERGAMLPGGRVQALRRYSKVIRH